MGQVEKYWNFSFEQMLGYKAFWIPLLIIAVAINVVNPNDVSIYRQLLGFIASLGIPFSFGIQRIHKITTEL